MSELTDISIVLRGHARQLAEQKDTNARVDSGLEEIQRRLALIDSAQQAFENQIEIFRDGINDQFRRLREGLHGPAGR